MRIAILLLVLVSLDAANSYQASIETWRKEHEAGINKPDGWLSVAGLFWLKDGDNRVGSDAKAEIALPSPAPRDVGVLRFRDGKMSFEAAGGARVTLNGSPVSHAELKTNKDRLRIGDITMFVIERGGKFGVRMLDPNNERRRAFSGLKWYPVKENYRVVAKFTAYDRPQKIAITNVLGQTEPEPSPGFATFDLMGHSYRLDPVLEGDHLFFIFRDQTAARTTYGAGRFLYAEMPKEGKVVLDFNRAENPPCAYTPYATCPLPPKQNRLSVKIEAGELTYGDH